MNQTEKHLEDLKIIRNVMEESSRFLSLSGLSGIIAGLLATGGAIAVKVVMDKYSASSEWYSYPLAADQGGKEMLGMLLAVMGVVLVLAVAAAVYFSARKARKSGKTAWTPVTRRMVASFTVPLLAGGIFILFTLKTVPANVSVASTMIFYGLAIISAGKFTFGEIHWLGVLMIVTGLVCLLLPSWSLVLWAAGFGAVHIIYGLLMHLRYRG